MIKKIVGLVVNGETAALYVCNGDVISLFTQGTYQYWEYQDSLDTKTLDYPHLKNTARTCNISH